MASHSDSPSNSVDNKLQSAASESVQQSAEGLQSSNLEAAKEKYSPSVFVNSEPIREDQVQNAVKFLAHPKVKGSPVMYRRSFLERKGLTKEEIDEAFRRVPDPAPAVSSSETAFANQDGQLKTSSNFQPQALVPSTQTGPASVGSLAKVGYLSQFHWSHVVLAVGFLGATGSVTAVFFKKSIIPRLKSWIRKAVLEEEETEEGAVKGQRLKPSLAEETAIAAKAAAAAAADVARASQEMVASKSEEKKYFMELTDLLSHQVREMKLLTSAIQKLEGPSNISQTYVSSGNPPFSDQDRRKVSQSNSQQFYGNGKLDTDARSGSILNNTARPLSPPTYMGPSGPQYPSPYMELLESVKRGERPSNMRDVNDQPPNPHQPLPEPTTTKPKPWEVGQTQIWNGSSGLIQSQKGGDNLSSSSNGGGGSRIPWRPQTPAKITEIEPEYEPDFGSSGIPTNNSAPPPRSWVPPQPPPVSMAEAAAAIRQPKKSLLQKDPTVDDQSQGGVSGVSEDLQMITKISESGGGGIPDGNGNLASGDSMAPLSEAGTTLE
ncbi:hypothetical protein DM860_000782 [Cuscuta australis]|uniref:Peroxisomal membrane protein PEX14 n=1 Tax=Cuscuta australis TaxID=267555 RepID=A0A328D095_9ASTE|nr:hypothetical protein DM860_000782 [Cuscuta australis]